jgi:hypothetical protein
MSENKPKISSPKVSTSKKSSEKINNISKELFEVIIPGFAGLDIHNDCSDNLETEISILPIITGHNAYENDQISKQMIDNAIIISFETANLTERARSHWFEVVHRLKDTKAEHSCGLLKILKIHNTDYYNNNLKKIIAKNINKIDLNDNFGYTEVMTKASNNAYVNPRYILSDVLRIMAKLSSFYIWKEYDGLSGSNFFKIKDEKFIKRDLSKIKLTVNDKKIEVWKIYESSNDIRFLYKGCSLIVLINKSTVTYTDLFGILLIILIRM